MEDRLTKIGRFISACDELVGGTYMNAETNISEVLKALAASEDLKGLFSAVTQEFDYHGSKSYYLRTPEGKRGAAYIPTDRVEALAFVFCLLVEIDSGKLRFNDLLLRYFYVDGSFTASYSLFADKIVRPFRDIVKEAYPITPVTREDVRSEQASGKLKMLSEKLSEERARLAVLPLPQEDILSGDAILSAVQAAAGRGEANEVLCLLAGYRYFLRCFGADCALTEEIFRLSSEL